MNLIRHDGRTERQIRPIFVQFDSYGYAHASVLFEQGYTKVLVSVLLQPNVPPFLKGKRTGWLSAEYAMLPQATHQRTTRESSQAQRNARSVEISRLIGRCLRPTIDLEAIGERSIIVDCDVLQADGGTRVACITAASIALKIACARWFEKKMIDRNIFKTQLVALSTGIVNGTAMADLSYDEDAQAEADFNFILTEDKALLEIQGTSEKSPMAWNSFDQLKELAIDGVADILRQLLQFPLPLRNTHHNLANSREPQETKQAFFSLAHRLNK